MIAYVRGILISKTPTCAVIETGGVGYQLHISLASFESLGEKGQELALHTYLHVTENDMQLFGFGDREEKALFQHLISVSGIGPKLAIGILSGLSVSAFREAVLHHNIERLTAAPGVGRKTAERLCLELREKIGRDTAGGETPGGGSSPSSIMDSSVEALVSLGFKKHKAREVVESILKANPDIVLEEVIRIALQKL